MIKPPPPSIDRVEKQKCLTGPGDKLDASLPHEFPKQETDLQNTVIDLAHQWIILILMDEKQISLIGTILLPEELYYTDDIRWLWQEIPH